MYDFAKEMYFDVKAPGNKSTRDKTLIKLLKSPGSLIPASGISNTIFLPSEFNNLGDRIKLILQEKRAGNNSDMVKEEIVVILDKLLEYKSITKKQHKQKLLKCHLLHTKKK